MAESDSQKPPGLWGAGAGKRPAPESAGKCEADFRMREVKALERIATALERLAAQHGVPSDWDGRDG